MPKVGAEKMTRSLVRSYKLEAVSSLINLILFEAFVKITLIHNCMYMKNAALEDDLEGVTSHPLSVKLLMVSMAHFISVNSFNTDSSSPFIIKEAIT